MVVANIPEKARKIFEEGKVTKEVDTQNRTHYKVVGDTETHSVIFDKKKNEWGCDCRYSALQRKDCSHIIAAKMKA